MSKQIEPQEKKKKKNVPTRFGHIKWCRKLEHIYIYIYIYIQSEK